MQSHYSFGPRPCSAGNIANLVRPDGMKIPLHRELIPMASMLIDVSEARGHNLPAYGTWGAACRYISGTRIWSDHAPGCAIDFDAPNNPYASAAWHRRNGNATIFGKRVRCNHPQWMFELWEEWGFYAGVRYDSKPDPMHLSYLRTVAQCRADTERLRALLKHPIAALPKPAAPKPSPLLKEMQNMSTFLARAIKTREVYLFEDGRYTLMHSRIDSDRIATNAGISKTEAEIGGNTFAALAQGRKKYT